MRPRLRLVATVALFWASVFVVGYLIYWIINRPGDRDFGSIYAAGYVGINSGWSHIYDSQFLYPIEAANHLDGFAVFPNPPPVAWMVVPLALLPFQWAAVIWQGLLVVALVAAGLLTAPARRWDRALILLSIFGSQPVLFALGYGTLSPVVLLMLVATLRAMEGERFVVAGVLLGLTAIKPQLTLLVLPVLLAAGYWRTAVTAIGVMVALALASIAVIGVSGTRDYISFLTSADVLNHPMPWTVKGIVGIGMASYIATALVVVATATVAFRFRPPPDLTLALGILASLFVAQHLNYGDFVLWLLPVWIAFRAGRPWWLQAAAVVTWMTGWVVVVAPFVSLTAEIVFMVAVVAASAAGSAVRMEPLRRSAIEQP